LDTLGRGAFEKIESVRKKLERERGLIEFPNDIHLLPPFTAEDKRNFDLVQSINRFSKCIWTENFLPVIEGKGLNQAVDAASATRMVNRYVRFQPHIANAIDSFYKQHLDGYHVIGVHVRGTDGFSAPARGVNIPFQGYFTEIERELETVGREKCRIFIASDEENFITIFKERFGDIVVVYDAIRKTDDDDIFGKGPTGQVLPAFITKSQDIAVRNGADVVIEYGLLCRTQIFFHNISSVSTAVNYSVQRAVRIY
jgi:hypothetical protein